MRSAMSMPSFRSSPWMRGAAHKQLDSTSVIPPGFAVTVDRLGNLLLQREGRA